MPKRARFAQHTIALVYDFDGTLSPQPMQEYTVLPKITQTPARFWAKVKKENEKQKATEVLTYMRLMFAQLDANEISIRRNDLKALAKNIKYFPGVETWFSRLNKFVRKASKNESAYSTT